MSTQPIEDQLAQKARCLDAALLCVARQAREIVTLRAALAYIAQHSHDDLMQVVALNALEEAVEAVQ